LIIISLLILILACDIERYYGYETKGQDLIESTRITGKLINRFTEGPVYAAKVNIDGLETLSNINGFFNLVYILTEDVQRNKPVNIQIDATNYFPFFAQRELEVDFNEFDFVLTYAAPIVENSARVAETRVTTILYCQAIIIDYQGADNIKKVMGTFHYTSDTGQKKQFTRELRFIATAASSYQRAYYQCVLDQDKDYAKRFTIHVTDKDGYSDTFINAAEPLMPDNFLFDPHY